MNNYHSMTAILEDMGKLAQALSIPPFPIYFLGGSACILGKYNDRATRDFDFIDLNYSASYGRVFRYLSDFDMLEYESTILSPSYRERAKRLTQFKYLEVFVLAREDIIVSKIIRMEQKDIEDIDILLKDSDRSLILKIIDEVIQRDDLFEIKKQAFKRNLPVFRERFHV